MELHSAKCAVLTKLANDLRHTIIGDMENLRFELCGADLISLTTRDSKDAGSMISEIENRLRSDESVWDGLMVVLRKYEKDALCSNLSTELKRKIGAGSALTSNIPSAGTNSSKL